MAYVRHQIASQMLGLLTSLAELTVLILVQIRRGPAFPIGGLLLPHVIENVCKCMGCGRRRCRRPQCAAHAAMKRPERAGARAETVGGQAQGATGPIMDRSTARGRAGRSDSP